MENTYALTEFSGSKDVKIVYISTLRSMNDDIVWGLWCYLRVERERKQEDDMLRSESSTYRI